MSMMLPSVARWFPYGPSETRAALPRLFCFPHAGAGASVYLKWRRFVSDLEIVPVQPPGQENCSGDAAPADFTVLASYAAEAIAACSRGPFALFGHSLGALLAFDVAQQLDRLPCCLVVSGRAGPSIPSRQCPAGLSTEALLDWTEAHYGALPPEATANSEARIYAANMLRSDFQVMASRAPTPTGLRVAYPITAIGGRDDAATTVADLMAWRKHSAEFRLRLFPGGHDFVRQIPAEVANAVASEVKRRIH